MIGDDPFEDEEWLAYADHALNVLMPKIESSDFVMSLVPRSGVDVKFGLELGFSIMLDKPIILAVPPGVGVPHKLVKVADAIVELTDPVEDPRNAERIAGACERIMRQQARKSRR